MLDKWKQKQMEKITKEQQENITNIKDLTGDGEPTFLFYILADKLGYLLDNSIEKSLSVKGLKIRKKINPLLRKVAPVFMKSKQVYEDRYQLMRNNEYNNNIVSFDEEIVLPDEPVIWIANHAFKDDVSATVAAVKRNAYILFGSLPQFYSTFDGVSAWINGVAMSNRKVKSSRKASVEKAEWILKNGTDLIIMPEGVWNKTQEKITLNLWPGVYHIALETGCKIVPIAHYLPEQMPSKKENNIIHTVIDEPIDISGMNEKEALELLRDKLSTWTYLMMEKYGKTTREELLDGFSNTDEAWEEHLKRRVDTTDKYDLEIEVKADYRPKDIVNPVDVWDPIAKIEDITPENASSVAYAKKLVNTEKKKDFQRRF